MASDCTSSYTFQTEDRQNDPVREQTLDISPTDSRIQLPPSGEHDIVEFTIPFNPPLPGEDETAPLAEHLVKITLNYATSEARRRLYSAVERVRMAVPVEFAHDVLCSEKGTHLSVVVLGVDEVPLRVVEAKMVVSGFSSVEEFFAASEQTLFHNQQLCFAYHLTPKNVAALTKKSSAVGVDTSTNRAQFIMKYYFLHEEIESHIITLLETLLDARSASQYASFLTQYLRDRILPKLNYTSYGLLDALAFPGFDRGGLETALSSEDREVRERLVGLVLEFQESIKTISMADVRSSVKVRPKTIVYNIELPVYQTLFIAELIQPSPKSTTFVVGDLVPCTLRITQTPMTTTNSLPQSLEIICEAMVNHDYWMFSGKKRRVLVFEPNNDLSIPITLIPLKVGMLPLPSFSLSPRPTSTESPDAPPIPVRIEFFGAEQVSVVPRPFSAQFVISDSPQAFATGIGRGVRGVSGWNEVKQSV